MKKVKITITDESGNVLDDFMVYDENSLTDEQCDNLDFNPEAEDIGAVEGFIKNAFNKIKG